MSAEFEAEREQLATVTDLRLAFKQARRDGKNGFTVDEILELPDDFAEAKKKHK